MKILIADDHWMVRESLKQVMKRVQQRFEPLEAATFNEALAILRDNPGVDLMLIDLIMPGFDEFDGLQKLRAEFPEIPVVVVSVHEDVDYVVRSISHGAIGYIPKSAGGAEIARALELVLAGEVSFPRHILERASSPTPLRQPKSIPEVKTDEVDSLTHREREVLDRIGEGLSVARIAAELKLSPHTVRVHLGNIMKKLGLKDRSAMIHYAVNLANTKFSQQ
ncbi:MAG: response regulator transcription factor [Gammaproteobacteria bacterium]